MGFRLGLGPDLGLGVLELVNASCLCEYSQRWKSKDVCESLTVITEASIQFHVVSQVTSRADWSSWRQVCVHGVVKEASKSFKRS